MDVFGSHGRRFAARPSNQASSLVGVCAVQGRGEDEPRVARENPSLVSRLASTRAGFVVAVLLAGWPIVRWYVARLGDGGDEPWGLVAIALAVGFTPRATWLEILPPRCVYFAGFAVLFVAATAGTFPTLVRAMIWVVALAVVIAQGPGAWGRGALLMLSLPVTATLQFFAGYPLRALTAELGRPLLWLAGVATQRVGVVLTWSGGEVVVDAPCSGVHMLWTGAVVAAALAAFFRLRVWHTLSLGFTAFLWVVTANALRAALLFLFESGLWPTYRGVHEGVGLVLFGLVISVLLKVGSGLATRSAVRA